MSSTKTSVCFVAPAVWPVFSGDTSLRSVGGAEVQQSILARALAEAGYDISFVTMDYDQEDEIMVDGVRIYKAYKPDGGLPVLRFIHPRLTALWRAMKRANAHIYYQRCAGMLTGVVAHFCRRHHRQMIYAAASDADFDPRIPSISYARDRWLYRYGLRHASQIVVQNPNQKAACLRTYRLSSVQVPSGYLPPASATANPRGYILWVSTMRYLKRPELFLQLASRLPEYRFRMIGGPAAHDRHLYKVVEREARELHNVEFMGFVSHSNIEKEFNGARLLINTSTHEGFPNTFLQAWARGIPTVSFLDSGLTQAQCGGNISVQTLVQMLDQIEQLCRDQNYYNRCSQLCRQYFYTKHSLVTAMSAYTNLFELMRIDANYAS